MILDRANISDVKGKIHDVILDSVVKLHSPINYYNSLTEKSRTQVIFVVYRDNSYLMDI